MASITPRVTTQITIFLETPKQPALTTRSPVTQVLTGVANSSHMPAQPPFPTPHSSENSKGPVKSILRPPSPKKVSWGNNEALSHEESLKRPYEGWEQTRLLTLRISLQNAVNKVQNTGNSKTQWTPDDADKVAPIKSMQSLAVPPVIPNPLLTRISAMRERLQAGISKMEPPVYRDHIKSQIHAMAQHAAQQYHARVQAQAIAETIAALPKQFDRNQLTILTEEVAKRSVEQIQERSKTDVASIEEKLTQYYLATPAEHRSRTQIESEIQAALQALRVKPSDPLNQSADGTSHKRTTR